MSEVAISIRPAVRSDAAAMARLHAAGITEGFLSSLGPAFLARLYGRIVRTPHAFALVADDGGRIVGFVAAAIDVGGLYRSFLVRDGVLAGLRAAPRLLRSLPRVVETLRYPNRPDLPTLPEPEILAVAVDARQHGRGHGRALVTAAVAELDRQGVGAVKVVAGADNAAARALYRATGFVDEHELRVHAATPSIAYVRPAAGVLR